MSDLWTIALRNVYNDLVNNRNKNIAVVEFMGMLGVGNPGYAHQILIGGNRNFPLRKAKNKDQRLHAQLLLRDLYNVNPAYFYDITSSMYVDDQLIALQSQENPLIQNLKEVNARLSEENRRLRLRLARLQRKLTK